MEIWIQTRSNERHFQQICRLFRFSCVSIAVPLVSSTCASKTTDGADRGQLITLWLFLISDLWPIGEVLQRSDLGLRIVCACLRVCAWGVRSHRPDVAEVRLFSPPKHISFNLRLSNMINDSSCLLDFLEHFVFCLLSSPFFTKPSPHILFVSNLCCLFFEHRSASWCVFFPPTSSLSLYHSFLQSFLSLRPFPFKCNIQVRPGQWFNALPDPGMPLERWLMMIMIMMMKRVCTLTPETTKPFQDTASAMKNITVTTHAFFFFNLHLHLHLLEHTCTAYIHLAV